eukprot:COSAG01_NODE_12348_length_1754_cov_5.155891_2_plen_63_part_01
MSEHTQVASMLPGPLQWGSPTTQTARVRNWFDCGISTDRALVNAEIEIVLSSLLCADTSGKIF